MMKNTNTAPTRKREGDRTVSARNHGEVWVYYIRCNSAKGARERSDKFSGREGEKTRNVSVRIYQRNNKEERKGGISNKL